MKIAEACNTLEAMAIDHGQSVLDLLIYMGDNLDDFSENEVRAYRMFMREGRKMFAQKEAA